MKKDCKGFPKNESNVKDLYHDKKIGGGAQFDPREPVMKPDVRINNFKSPRANEVRTNDFKMKNVPSPRC